VRVVGRAHDQGCAEVRYLLRRLGISRVGANVDSETQIIDLEDVAIASSIENVFAAEEVH
jgi:hypothetical protein